MNQVLADCHMHTCHSPDSQANLFDMCLAAQHKGASIVTITDHCEMNLYYERYQNVLEESQSDTIETRKRFRDMKILLGIEMGQPLQDVVASNEMLGDYRFDFVLASLHNPPKDCGYPLCKEKEENPDYVEAFENKDYAYLKYTKETTPIIITDYFERLYKMSLWGKFDSLSHITYPIRYCKGEQGVTVDIKQYYPIITEIYKALIQRDIALELNSAGLRNPVHETAPNYELLKLYKECGGKLITLGADAHTTAHVADGIPECIEMLKSLDFDAYYYFERRRPVAVPIV